MVKFSKKAAVGLGIVAVAGTAISSKAYKWHHWRLHYYHFRDSYDNPIYVCAVHRQSDTQIIGIKRGTGTHLELENDELPTYKRLFHTLYANNKVRRIDPMTESTGFDDQTMKRQERVFINLEGFNNWEAYMSSDTTL